MKYQTTFYWRDHLLANADEAGLWATHMAKVAVRDGIMVVNAGEWSRAFPVDQLLYMETLLVDE